MRTPADARVEDGLTVVEVLIVAALVALLISVALPYRAPDEREMASDCLLAQAVALVEQQHIHAMTTGQWQSATLPSTVELQTWLGSLDWLHVEDGVAADEVLLVTALPDGSGRAIGMALDGIAPPSCRDG